MNKPSVRFSRLPRLECFEGNGDEKPNGNFTEILSTNTLAVLVLSSPKNVEERMKLRREVRRYFKQIKQSKFC